MVSISTNSTTEFLQEFMNIYWLRPETALWRTLDCQVMSDIEFTRPMADVGCGDGLFSFTRAGGRIAPDYDMFVQAANLDHFFEGVDIYNHFDPNAKGPKVVKQPDYQIDLGLDHKTALLKKAALLGCYDKTQQADANGELPVESSRFKTVFSNILYWLENYRHTLREFHRILTDDGKVVVVVPAENYKDHLVYNRLHLKTGDPKWKWLSLIDRGRSENIKLCRSCEAWTSDFQDAGFEVSVHKRFLSKTAIQVWDIGLRPISPLLIEMTNELTEKRRMEIKDKWIKELIPLIRPLCDMENDKDHPATFHLFVLRKK